MNLNREYLREFLRKIIGILIGQWCWFGVFKQSVFYNQIQRKS